MSLLVTTTSAGQAGPFTFGTIELVENTPANRQISVFVNDVVQTEGIHYTVDQTQQAVYFIFPYPSSGTTVLIQRLLPYTRINTYTDGQALQADELNANYDHLRLLSESMTDYSASPPTTRPATNLFELADVDQSIIPSEGDMLQYDEATGLWQASPFAATLEGLADTSGLDVIASGTQTLYYHSPSQDWREYEIQYFRPDEQSTVWEQGVIFKSRPRVSADALATPVAANEIPTVSDIETMMTEVDTSIRSGILAQTQDALDALDGTAMESGLLAAVEWKYGVRFATWRDYVNSTRDWPELNGPVTYGDLLPDGAEAITRTTLTSAVTDTGGPTFVKNPNRRFLPAKRQGRVAGSFTIDPGVYLNYPNLSSNITDGSVWVRDLGGLIKSINIAGLRTNQDNDQILQVVVELDTAQSSSAIQVAGNRTGLMPRLTDYVGTQGYAGIYRVTPQTFTMNIPVAWFLYATTTGQTPSVYRALAFRVYGDRSLDASINTTRTSFL